MCRHATLYSLEHPVVVLQFTKRSWVHILRTGKVTSHLWQHYRHHSWAVGVQHDVCRVEAPSFCPGTRPTGPPAVHQTTNILHNRAKATHTAQIVCGTTSSHASLLECISCAVRVCAHTTAYSWPHSLESGMVALSTPSPLSRSHRQHRTAPHLNPSQHTQIPTPPLLPTPCAPPPIFPLTLSLESCMCHTSPVLLVAGSRTTSRYLLPSARIRHRDMDVAWRENTYRQARGTHTHTQRASVEQHDRNVPTQLGSTHTPRKKDCSSSINCRW